MKGPVGSTWDQSPFLIITMTSIFNKGFPNFDISWEPCVLLHITTILHYACCLADQRTGLRSTGARTCPYPGNMLSNCQVVYLLLRSYCLSQLLIQVRRSYHSQLGSVDRQCLSISSSWRGLEQIRPHDAFDCTQLH